METNVVVARFTGYATVTDMRYRWDYGQKLKVEGIADLPDYFEVHFSNAPSVGTAKVWLGQNGVVDIPDEYLATGEPVYAWIFLHAGETDGETVYSILIPVKKRPKPVNDAPTPVQKSELDTAIAILQTASATATEQATIATGAATTATEAAETATSAVADVEAAATRAEQAAEGAEASATDAQAAARSAELSAQTAQLAKSAAETAAANAEQSATDAGNYAGLAEAAEQDAQAAKTAAEASATSAAASATQAQESATQAAQKASEAFQSASQALSYKTDAESAKTASQTAQGLAESARDTAVSAKDDSESARDDAVQAKTDVQNIADGIDTRLVDVESALIDKAPIITDTASGSIASFSDGADNLPLKSLIVDINPVQDLHGYDSPWPAGGGKNLFQTTAQSKTENGVTWTVNADGTVEVSGTATGYTDFEIGLARVDSSMGNITVSGIASATNIAWGSVQVRDVNLNVLYIIANGGTQSELHCDLSQYPDAYYVRVLVKRNNNVVTSGTVKIQVEKGSTATDWTPYENLCPISGWTEAQVVRTGKNLFDESIFANSGGVLQDSGMYYFAAVAPLLDKVFYENNGYTGQLSITLTRQTEENKQSLRATIQYTDGTTEKIGNLFATGGVDTYTVVTSAGKVVSKIIGDYGNNLNTYAKLQIELGSTATPYSPYTGRSITINLGQTVYGGKLDVLSGELTVYPYYASYNGETLTGKWISDRDKYVSGTTPTIGAQVVNIGAQGVTVQLEPHEVESLYGVNNLWADSGDTTCVYRADTKAYIAKKLTTAIANALNS